jgi:hypothetical protein
VTTQGLVRRVLAVDVGVTRRDELLERDEIDVGEPLQVETALSELCGPSRARIDPNSS